MTSEGFGVFIPTYPNHILYYISLFCQIRCSLTYLSTYLPKNLASYILICQLCTYLGKAKEPDYDILR